MAYPLPHPRADAALTVPTAYRRVVSADVTRGAESETYVPTDFSATADGRTPSRWSGSLSLRLDRGDDPPTRLGELLTPAGTLVAVRAGIVLSDGVVSDVPVGTFAVSASSARVGPGESTVSLSLADLSTRIAGHRFESPLTVAGGIDLAELAGAIATDRAPGLDLAPPTLVGTTLRRGRTFGLDTSTDPWAELADVLAAHGFSAWFDREGRLVVGETQRPVTSPREVDAGEVSVDFSSRPANVVVARGETPDGVPLQAVVADEDPDSPTDVNGPYGRVTRFYESDLLTTLDQTTSAGLAILSRTESGGAGWQVSRSYDPTWDPNDGMLVPLPSGRTMTLVVDAVTFDAAGSTGMQCREAVAS